MNRLWWFDLAAEDRLAMKIAKMVWSGFSGETGVVEGQPTVTEGNAAPAARVW